MPRNFKYSTSKRAAPVHRPSLWSLFADRVDPDEFQAIQEGEKPSVQQYNIKGIFEDDIRIRHLQAKRQFRTSGREPVLANVVFVDEIDFSDLMTDDSKSHFDERESNKSWLRRYETNLDYFRYQTKMDEVVNAVKRTIRQPDFRRLYHEIYIPIVDNNAHFFIRIVVTPESSAEAVKIFCHKDIALKSKSQSASAKAKKVREHLVHSLGFAFNYPLNKKSNILIEEKPGLFTREGFWNVFAPNTRFGKRLAIYAKETSSFDDCLQTPIDYHFNDDVLPNIYNGALDESKRSFGENDDVRKMLYDKHTPDIFKSVKYTPNNQTWTQRRANGRLYTIWCQVLYVFTLIASVVTQGGRAAAEAKEAQLPKTNLTALRRTDFTVEMTIAITLTLAACIAIVAVASVGGPAAFIALPAMKMLTTYGAAAAASLKAIVSLSLPKGLEGWAALVAFSSSWVAEKTFLPLLWRTIKLPFRGGWEPKEDSQLDWKNLFRIHAWRKRGNFVPLMTQYSVLYTDMRDNFSSTKKTFVPLFDFIHSQYKRYTIAGARVARYEEELAYWARLRRKMREGKIDQVARVLHYYVGKRSRYANEMRQYWRREIGNDQWNAINHLLQERIREKNLINDYRKTETELREHLAACKKDILAKLNDTPSEAHIPGGDSLPPYNAKELYDNFCDWWLESRRVAILRHCLKKIDSKVVLASGQPSLSEACKLERDAAKKQRTARHQQKQGAAGSYGDMSNYGLSQSMYEPGSGGHAGHEQSFDHDAPMLVDGTPVSPIQPIVTASRHGTLRRAATARQFLAADLFAEAAPEAEKPVSPPASSPSRPMLSGSDRNSAVSHSVFFRN